MAQIALIVPLGDLRGHLPSRPTDPGWGIEGPVDPGYGIEVGGGISQLPWQRPPHVGGGPLPTWPGRPSTGPVWPGRGPVDPGFGIDAGGVPTNPIEPPTEGPGSPGHPIELPPGIWPPAGAVTPPIAIRPDLPPAMVIWVPGVGFKVFFVKPPQVTPPIAGMPPVAQPKR